MPSAASVTGNWADIIQLRGLERTVSTAPAKLDAVHGVTVPQLIPASTSTRYFTSVAPVPMTVALPEAMVKVPEPFVGTPSLTGLDDEPVLGMSPSALWV